MLNSGFWGRFGDVAWRLGAVPGASETPDRGVVDLVEGPDRLPPEIGRAHV